MSLVTFVARVGTTGKGALFSAATDLLRFVRVYDALHRVARPIMILAS
ncbi:hypothetical protein [Mycobacterium lepromatosis]|nr:hypothetical protein [Mycobacterium lepromatosis]